MAAATDPSQIRKLRKKLRQIENLERTTRELTEEETLKVERKIEIRESLLDLLSEHGETTQISDLSNTLNSLESSLEYDSLHQVDSINLPDTREENLNKNCNRVLHEEEESQTQERREEGVHAACKEQSESKKIRLGASETLKEQSSQESAETCISPKPHLPVPQPVSSKHEDVASRTNDSQKIKDINKGKNEKLSLHLERKKWLSSLFRVCLLAGHNDLITDLDTDGKLLLSASRDTTVKVWDLTRLEEKRSLGGHTNIVTSVQLLSEEQSQALCSSYDDVSADERLVISGSLDCSIRVWSLKTGQCIKDIYTFDPVTKLCYHGDLQVAFTGSAGGKLAVWDVRSGEVIHSVCAHQESISGLQFCSPYLYSASEDGLIQVHELREQALFRVFLSENVQKAGGGEVTSRLIRAIAASQHKVFYGDDGDNLKILDWKTGLVTKLLNNTGEFGSTDSVCCTRNLLLASGYDLDNGLGFINVRCFDHGGEYLSTLSDEDTERIMCLACHHGPNDKLIIASGGSDLKVWIKLKEIRDDQSEGVVRPKFLAALSGKAVDSDVDSDFDSDEDGEVIQQLRSRRLSLGGLGDRGNSTGWLSWCSII